LKKTVLKAVTEKVSCSEVKLWRRMVCPCLQGAYLSIDDISSWGSIQEGELIQWKGWCQPFLGWMETLEMDWEQGWLRSKNNARRHLLTDEQLFLQFPSALIHTRQSLSPWFHFAF
jgi:hypothetical protein